MQNKWTIIAALLALIVLISAFGSDATDRELDYPNSWPSPVYDFSNNAMSEEGVALGRHLFYDPILSMDSTVSCANCHLSYTAFTHVDHALSHGINDRVGTRNSMTLMNLAWSSSFMWDGAVNHLDMQALAPITHVDEMGADIAMVVNKINESELYRSRFKAAFGAEEATGERLLKALAQFQLTLISANSKYDQVMRKEPGVSFTDQEHRGKELFKANCAACHRGPMFTSGQFSNNGLPIDYELMDTGRMMITKDSADSLKFKIPTLRNIEFSRPYMHDGRFKTLGEVLDHYQHGIQHGPTLDPVLEDGVQLSSNDKVDLMAYLLTLSDKEFLFNPKHAFPKIK